MAATRRLNELITATLPDIELPDGPMVVALSGGADSATLAYLVRQAGFVTRALHIDHQLPASPTMAAAAEEIAAVLEVPLETVQVDLDDGPSLEEKARTARYRVFTGVGTPVLTGHTRDDSVETMLINLVRGTGIEGLTGIPAFRSPNIHRPLLSVTRSETREIATLAGLPFVDDPMNEDLSITRNRIRREILPLMRELNPQLDAAVARAAAILEREADYLAVLAAPHMRSPVPVSVIHTLPRVLADRVLQRALEAEGIGATADRIGRIWAVASGVSERQDLAEGRSVVRRGALLVIE